MRAALNLCWVGLIVLAAAVHATNALLALLAISVWDVALEVKALRTQLTPMADLYAEEPWDGDATTTEAVMEAVRANEAVTRARDALAARMAAIRQDQDRRTADALRGMRES